MKQTFAFRDTPVEKHCSYHQFLSVLSAFMIHSYDDLIERKKEGKKKRKRKIGSENKESNIE